MREREIELAIPYVGRVFPRNFEFSPKLPRVFPRNFEFSQTPTSVSTLFRVLPNSHECFHAISSSPKLPRVFPRYFEFSQTPTSVSTLFRVLPNFHECFHGISSSPKLPRVFPRYFEFSQTPTSVSITYGNTGGNVFYFFCKISRKKLKCGNSLLYQNLNSPRSNW